MNIAIIGPGRRPIPPIDNGAIENIIWNYKLHLVALGHKVDIYNNIWIHETVYEINRNKYDFIHLHFDLYAAFCNKYLQQPFCVTSHTGGFAKFIPGQYYYYPAFNYLFQDTLESPGNIVLSPEIEKKYRESGYKKFLKVLHNPVESDKFHVGRKGNGKAICVGIITPRKRQAYLANLLQNKVLVDFVGPYDKNLEPHFHTNETSKYIGVWTKAYLYEHLTEYSSLVLLSESEADPLVVKEALAAGVSVVVSEGASYNLTKEDFITVIPDGMKDDDIAQAIQVSIDKNDEQREKIRKYTEKRFSYQNLTKEYIKIMKEFRSIASY